jgi:hypothetical protein
MADVPVTVPPQFREEAGQFPPLLRALLEAELAAGNAIAEVGHRFPAPPAGAYFKMTGPVTTRPRASGDGLKFREVNASIYNGFFTDERGFYFIVEPPLPPPPEPDMDAIRAAHAPPPFLPPPPPDVDPLPALAFPLPLPPVTSDPQSAFRRFESSMVMDYEKWHDGIGYDIEALQSATGIERDAIEILVLNRRAKDWRDVEALAALGTPQAIRALRLAARSPDAEIRLAVVNYAPELVPETQRISSLVSALGSASFGSGLSQALDEAAGFHPKPVVDALLRGALRREGEAAVHFAALTMFIYGKASSAFDWDQRPFFLRFNTPDRNARETAFRELCAKIGVDSAVYL